MVIIHTSKGDITVNLFTDKAPETCKNFIKYANEQHYTGTIFHRVIKGFMIQGGGLTADMRKKDTDKPIKNEADNGLKNSKYTIAMARTAEPHSATSQFFINTADNSYLNFRSKTEEGWGYCVFGEVVDGKDVVDAIEAVKTGRSGMYSDVPTETIIINGVDVE
jgi:peptidyl-prolyl cis-trans isomerase B (cyclophilin B)